MEIVYINRMISPISRIVFIVSKIEVIHSALCFSALFTIFKGYEPGLQRAEYLLKLFPIFYLCVFHTFQLFFGVFHTNQPFLSCAGHTIFTHTYLCFLHIPTYLHFLFQYSYFYIFLFSEILISLFLYSYFYISYISISEIPIFLFLYFLYSYF